MGSPYTEINGDNINEFLGKDFLNNERVNWTANRLYTSENAIETIRGLNDLYKQDKITNLQLHKASDVINWNTIPSDAKYMVIDGQKINVDTAIVTDDNDPFNVADAEEIYFLDENEKVVEWLKKNSESFLADEDSTGNEDTNAVHFETADSANETITEKIAGVKDVVTNFITSNNVSQFLKKAAQSYDSETALDVKTRIQNRIGEFDEIKKQIENCLLMFPSLNDLTETKLSENKSITLDKVTTDLYEYIKKWNNKLSDIAYLFGIQMEKIEGEDEKKSGNETGSFNVIKSNSSGGSSGSRGSSSSNKPSINEIVIEGGGAAIALAGAIVGVVKFKEIVTMYESIGSGVGVQSNLTGNYGLIGIVKDNGKNYYKILDKDNNKVYYIEINDKVEIQTDLNKLLEVNDKAMMLTTTEIGSDNFSKFADTNTLYFIQNEIQKDNINFMNVIDSSDGKDYYIPLGDTVNVVSLDSIIKPNEGTIK